MDRPIRIILNEDLPSDAYLVEREFKRAGVPYEFLVTDNKEDFTRALNRLSPDIILSDYSLPGFDWSAALRITREKMPGLPFLIVSSSTNPKIIETCLNAGVSGFLSKDELGILVAKVQELVNNHG